MPYYSVAKGRSIGIYLTWKECQKQIIHYPCAIYKKFDTLIDAKNFIKDNISKTEESKVDKLNDNETNIEIDDKIIIFTDGSCRLNQKGGYGYYIPSLNIKKCGPIDPPFTNNRAELIAIITAIREFKPEQKLYIVTDSKYALLIFNQTGLKYQSNGYQTKNGTTVPNADLVKQAVELSQQYQLTFRHIDAHTGKQDFYSLGNQVADHLAEIGSNIKR